MTHKRILILDDHEAILEIVTEALLYENFVVRGISFGRDLFASIGSFEPELILLDYKLADDNGGDLCAQLKNDIRYQHIPVIIFSAYFNPTDKVRPGGCDDVLYKPFDLDILLKTVHQNLGVAKPIV